MFVGLDTETTGLTPGKHKVIQIGVAFGAMDVWCQDVGWRVEDGELTIEPKTLEINGFTVHRIYAAVQREFVDRDTAAICLSRAFHPESPQPERLIAVGWNVGSFDIPMISDCLPQTAACFHYQSVELNSICFALGDHAKWKARAKAAALEILGTKNEHNAGSDAAESLIAFYWLRDEIARQGAR